MICPKEISILTSVFLVMFCFVFFVVVVVFLLTPAFNERDVMLLSLPDYNQTDFIEAFNSNSTYLDDLHVLNIDNPFFEQKVD